MNLCAVGDERFADREEGVQIVCKAIEIGQHNPVGTGKRVIGKNGRQGHRQPGSGHDQGLADGTCDLLQGGLPRHADRHQRVVKPPYGTEQPNEGCGRASGRQQGQSVFHTGLRIQELLTERPLHLFGRIEARREMVAGRRDFAVATRRLRCQQGIRIADTGFAETIAVFSGLIQLKSMRVVFDQGNAKSPFLQAGNQFFQIGCFSCT